LVSDSPQPSGFLNVIARTIGETREDALAGAEFVLNAFAFGRLAYIRVKPEANSETDFDTKVTRHRGFVRFSYRLESGDWQYPEINTIIPSLGGFA
jgi:hypothetical protein